MSDIYEPTDPLSLPFECFSYDSDRLPVPVPPHWHYFAELLLIREGNVLICSNNINYTVHPGEAFFVYPNLVHSIDSEDGCHVLYDVIKLDISRFSESSSYAPQLRSVLEDIALQGLSPLFGAEAVRDMQLGARMTECIAEYQGHRYGYDLTAKSQIYIILTLMLRQWMKNGFTLQQRIFQSDLLGSISSITAYISSHLQEPLRVNDLARHCRMSYSVFARKFRSLYGISCKEYIEKLRTARVEHFLLFTDCELNFICQETGYADCSHMIKDFKRIHGVTPRRYRTEHRK